jgi:ABC-type multidrug transport system ATPase subunit
VVLSIHQPRPEIALQFDAICLLTRGGRMVYYGSYVDSVAYFGAVPFLEARAGGNVMEYIMDLSVKDTTSTEERERELVERINMLVEHWKRAAGAGPQRLGLAADGEREADAEKHEVTALSPLGSGPGEVVRAPPSANSLSTTSAALRPRAPTAS